MRVINIVKKPMFHVVIDLEMTCFMNIKNDHLGQYFVEEGKEKTRLYLNGKSQEAIEIGAVMLDSNFEIIKEFQSYIKPSRNPILTGFCKGMTGITQEQIDSAPSFEEVMQNFATWVGEDKFCLYTWSNSDTKQLQKDFVNNKCNLDLLHNLTKRTYNLQKDLSVIYNKVVTGRKGQTLGLKRAIALLRINSNNRHHSASGDAKDTAEILRIIRKPAFDINEFVQTA